MTPDQEAQCNHVDALIKAVREAGMTEAAEVFSNAYWGYIRVSDAYRNGIAYVDAPGDCGCDRASGVMHVTTFTLDQWSPLIPGAHAIDNEAVRREDADDEAWHRAEDRRMRIAAGEDIL